MIVAALVPYAVGFLAFILITYYSSVRGGSDNTNTDDNDTPSSYLKKETNFTSRYLHTSIDLSPPPLSLIFT